MGSQGRQDVPVCLQGSSGDFRAVLSIASPTKQEGVSRRQLSLELDSQKLNFNTEFCQRQIESEA